MFKKKKKKATTTDSSMPKTPLHLVKGLITATPTFLSVEDALRVCAVVTSFTRRDIRMITRELEMKNETMDGLVAVCSYALRASDWLKTHERAACASEFRKLAQEFSTATPGKSLEEWKIHTGAWWVLRKLVDPRAKAAQCRKR